MLSARQMVAVCGTVLDRKGRVSAGLALAPWLIFVCANAAEGQIYAVVDTPPTPSVTYILSHTQVNVHDGGNVASNVSMFSSSELDVYGGTVGGRFNANSGTTTNVYGGFVDGGFNANDGAVVNLYGGTLNGITVNINSVLNVSGGTLGSTTIKNGGKATITGGTIRGFHADPNSLINISGGTFGDNVSLYNANATITGGHFLGGVSFGDYLSPYVVNFSGASIDHGFGLSGQLNMSSGSVGSGSVVRLGTLNLSGGSIGDFFTADDYSFINITAGKFGYNFNAKSGSTINMTGGSFGDAVYLNAGSSLTLSGAEFKLDGGPIAGLDTIGNSIPFNPPDGSALTGVLADGTPFAYSSLDLDHFANGTLTLKRATVPPIGPATIDLQHDPVPLGIRNGQTLVVSAGTSLPDNFVAGDGSSVAVSGGTVGTNLEAVGAHVSITSGEVGGRLGAFRGSTIDVSGGAVAQANAFPGGALNISGGTIGQDLTAYSGGVVKISGGTIGDGFFAQTGSSIEILGGDFRLDGSIVPGTDVPANTAAVNIPSGSVLSGTLADGTPFAFSDLERDAIADGTVTMRVSSLPAAAPTIIHVPGDAPKSIRGGQTLAVGDGGSVAPQFNAGWGSNVQITGGTVAEDFEAVGSEIGISGGHVEDFAVWKSHVLITGGTIGHDYAKGLRAGSDSTVDVSGGTLSQYTTIDHSVINVTGGYIDGLDLQNHATANISGGFVDINFVDHSTVNMSTGNGTITDVVEGGVINISGDSHLDEIEVGNGGVANISGGTVDYDCYIEAGALMNITGGSLSDEFIVEGGTVNVKGGTFGKQFGARNGAIVNLFGTKFWLNDLPIDGLNSGQPFLVTDRDGYILTGLLVDGSPFTFDLTSRTWSSHGFFNEGATLSLVLVSVPEPTGQILVLIFALMSLPSRIAVRRR